MEWSKLVLNLHTLKGGHMEMLFGGTSPRKDSCRPAQEDLPGRAPLFVINVSFLFWPCCSSPLETAMAARNECYASCPAATVTIQPPPFTLNIPGPAIYCPNQELRIEQHNPCAGGGGGSSRLVPAFFIEEDFAYPALESGYGYGSSLAALYLNRMALPSTYSRF